MKLAQFSAIHLSPYRKGWEPSFGKKLEFQSPKDVLWILGLNWPKMVLEKIIKFRKYIYAASLYTPFGRLFIWTNLNPHHPLMLCAKFGWNRPLVLEKIKTFKFLYFVIFSSVKGRGPSFLPYLRMLCVISLQQQQPRRTTDKLWSDKHTWGFGCLRDELKTELRIIYSMYPVHPYN